MIDPFTAVAAATTAFNTVKKFVHAGQEFENCMGQMGKWYGAVSDFRKGQQMQRKPPIFRKLLAAGSVEEEALNLLIHDKKVMEMETRATSKCLTFGLVMVLGTNLKKCNVVLEQSERKKFTKLLKLDKNLLNGVAIIGAILALVGVVGGLFYFIAKAKGMV